MATTTGKVKKTTTTRTTTTVRADPYWDGAVPHLVEVRGDGVAHHPVIYGYDVADVLCDVGELLNRWEGVRVVSIKALDPAAFEAAVAAVPGPDAA
ncbi:MAG: hypothetical protein K2X87_33815 [Gemmataceae bacterium]|nr:hypothetical protein [Gemmataceae bacterium]